MRLTPYQFEVVYRPEKQNCLAEALFKYNAQSEEPVSYVNSAPLFFSSKVYLLTL